MCPHQTMHMLVTFNNWLAWWLFSLEVRKLRWRGAQMFCWKILQNPHQPIITRLQPNKQDPMRLFYVLSEDIWGWKHKINGSYFTHDHIYVSSHMVCKLTIYACMRVLLKYRYRLIYMWSFRQIQWCVVCV